MLISITLLAALLIDFVFGEPKRWHPLVGFGNVANWLESKLNSHHRFLSYLMGFIAWSLMVLPAVILVWWTTQTQTLVSPVYFDFILGIVFLTFALGTKSLMQHARAVGKALESSDISLARKNIGMIVSRDTSDSDETAITKATIESVLENGSDAIFAAIFWFVLFGAPGVIFYRLANTLDAMWGYKTERFTHFGWAAARIDDALNWLPARLTALSYAIAGSTRNAVSCWFKQGSQWHGINPGVVMATGAGALQVLLGGAARYHGENVQRPLLGSHNEPKVTDIERSIKLVYKSIFIWVLVIAVGEYFIVG